MEPRMAQTGRRVQYSAGRAEAPEGHSGALEGHSLINASDILMFVDQVCGDWHYFWFADCRGNDSRSVYST